MIGRSGGCRGEAKPAAGRGQGRGRVAPPRRRGGQVRAARRVPAHGARPRYGPAGAAGDEPRQDRGAVPPRRHDGRGRRRVARPVALQPQEGCRVAGRGVARGVHSDLPAGLQEDKRPGPRRRRVVRAPARDPHSQGRGGARQGNHEPARRHRRAVEAQRVQDRHGDLRTVPSRAGGPAHGPRGRAYGRRDRPCGARGRRAQGHHARGRDPTHSKCRPRARARPKQIN